MPKTREPSLLITFESVSDCDDRTAVEFENVTFFSARSASAALRRIGGAVPDGAYAKVRGVAVARGGTELRFDLNPRGDSGEDTDFRAHCENALAFYRRVRDERNPSYAIYAKHAKNAIRTYERILAACDRSEGRPESLLESARARRGKAPNARAGA